MNRVSTRGRGRGHGGNYIPQPRAGSSSDSEDDTKWYRQEVGEEPDPGQSHDFHVISHDVTWSSPTCLSIQTPLSLAPPSRGRGGEVQVASQEARDGSKELVGVEGGQVRGRVVGREVREQGNLEGEEREGEEEGGG